MAKLTTQIPAELKLKKGFGGPASLQPGKTSQGGEEDKMSIP